jgi:uncharacterized protein YecE (DUF72 family)
MRVLVGTSGYSYKEWKGPFYPKDVPAARFLSFYAGQLATVEINNTFYRMPTAKLVQGWASEVPESFTFAIKAPQRITHIAKLLFQLPPFLKKDAPRLREFLETTRALEGASAVRLAFEFRHASWFDEEIFDVLRAHQASLCVAEGESLESPLVATATWGYVRLRRDEYPDDVLAAWAKKIRAQAWSDVFVYLKHDDGDAPGVAKRLIAMLG